MTLDPFATDFFGSGGAAAGPAKKVARSKEAPARAGSAFVREWHRTLPKVTTEQARLSGMLALLPGAISLGTISSVLARYARVSSELVTVNRVDLREVDRADARLCCEERRVVAELATGGNDSPLSVEVDPSFAAELVDRMLGGDGLKPESLRDLSRIEHAVIEFLCLMLCHELNDDLGVPLLRLIRVTTAGSPWLDQEAHPRAGANGGATRLLVATFHASVGHISGLARIYCPPSAVAELNRALATAGSDAGVITRLETIASEVPVAVAIGQTEISAGEIGDLERGDVVVISQPLTYWADGHIRGSVRARVGEGEKTIISGRTVESSRDEADPRDRSLSFGSGLKLQIETISAEDPLMSSGMFTMEERLRAEETRGDAAGVLDGLLVTVHVELAARRIRMNQLAQLRIGQIVELGCSASDPVDLVVDGRLVARGELVDVEGRLGVRITQPPG